MIWKRIQIKRVYGIGYLYAWLHRLAGVGLLLFLWAHIYALSLLVEPDKFDLKVEWLNRLGLYYLEWLIALPLIFHTINGGRLILYEVFDNRRDDLMAKWVAGITIIYTLILLLVMYVANISTTPSIWVIAWLFGLGMAAIVIIGTSASKIGMPWKLQRISGGILLLMLPVHMVLMHADPMAGHDAGTIVERLQSDILIKVADVIMVVSALYHGAYGLMSIAKDYLTSITLIQSLLVLIGMVSVIFGWLGIKTLILL
jgi:succinate dehydrogenase/fumarate reductase cytochrome b subunit